MNQELRIKNNLQFSCLFGRQICFIFPKNRSNCILKIKNSWLVQRGFTYVETILYVAIISIILTALIPFTWNIIEGSSKNAIQEEVSSQARLISERITYEIRNAVDITSVTSSTLTLCENSANCSLAANQTVINFTGSSVTINQANGGATVLDSSDVTVTGSFTNNSSGVLTKNVSFTLTVTTNTSSRNEYNASETIQSSAELRNI